MVRSVLRKAAWVGRTASMVLGLAFVLGLVVGLADAALGANGQAWVLGKINQATATTQLNASVAGKAALVVANPNTAPASRALHLNVAQGKAPMAVNSSTRVANLNADKLDGLEAAALAPRSGFDATEVIETNGPLPPEGIERTFTSNGGKLIIMASGSAFRSSANARFNGRIGVFVTLNGGGLAMTGYTNEMNSHKALVSDFLVREGVPAGTHKIKILPVNNFDCNGAGEESGDYCTTTDHNDFFRVTVLEIPD